MSHAARFTYEKVPLNIDGVQLDLAVIHRTGPKTPILFLHGFGSTKEDYADITLQASLKDTPSLPMMHQAAVKRSAPTSRASTSHFS